MSISGITTRELEILRLIATGMRNQEIADQLVISLTSVKRHTGNTYRKLGVEHRTEAVAQLTTRVCFRRSIKPNYTLEVHPICTLRLRAALAPTLSVAVGVRRTAVASEGRLQSMSSADVSTRRQHEFDVHELRVQGHLDERWADWLEGLTLTHEDDDTTTLAGPLADEAALHGVLNRIRDLAVPIVSVRRVCPHRDHSVKGYELSDALNTFILQHASACTVQDKGIDALAAILPACAA